MIRASLGRIGITFDVFFNEMSLYEDGSVWRTLDALREKGLVYEAPTPERDEDYEERPDEEELDAASGGATATWIRMRKLRNVKKDKALVKSDGEPTYRLPDTAYHINSWSAASTSRSTSSAPTTSRRRRTFTLWSLRWVTPPTASA